MIAIIDYGCGNLFSVKNALEFLNVDCVITNDIKILETADKYILPGVGAFPQAMKLLNESGLSEFLKQNKKPLLGICLGMQMLFDVGFEFEETKGLGLISGSVIEIKKAEGLKIPHMGWNELVLCEKSPLLEGISNGDCVYFVHSFMAKTENVCAYSDYSVKISALVQNKNVFGTQFHPEKSGETGLKILKNFADLV